MLAKQTNQANLAEFSRCEDRSWLPVEKQKARDKKDNADASIAEKVDRAVWNNDMLRSTDYREIDVAVKDGVVFLSGHVISVSNQQLAEECAANIPGVRGVINYVRAPGNEVLFPVESIEDINQTEREPAIIPAMFL